MMPNTVNTYTGDGVLTDFTISFTYLDEDYINFTVENEIFEDVTENYTGSMFDPSTFRFTVAIPNNYRVTFKRVTDINNDMFGWESGAVIRPADLSQTLKRLKDFSEENADQTIAATVTAESDAISSATTQSAASAAAAASSASAASSSASAASSSATAAAASETNAGTSEANAAASASAAATSATNSATSATNSAASATTAANEATDAATQATNAAASATAAATSETNAASSASAAATVQTNMVALKDELLGIYLGSHVDDTAANAHAVAESYSLDSGDLYFDETAGRMKVYNGSSWVGVASSIDATNASNSATAAQTAQSAAEAALATLLNKFHGSWASDAAVEADITGDADLTLEAGDQYFNTTTSRIRYYDGASWYDAAATQVIDTSALGNVGDVNLTGLAAGDLIKRVGTEWVNVPDTDYVKSADYTAADVRTKVAAATDSNVFTDAEKTKLTGVETGATADQTGAEIKALYEAEANAYTDAKDTKLAGIETGATADQTGAEIKALYEAEANAFTDTLKTKLDGIEANADVTDAANVDAAGAVMGTDTDVSGTSFVLDEDDMASDSATKVPTQQSVKAYVDGKVGVIEQNSKTAAYTLLASDAGKHISITTGGVTVDASVHAVGDAITIFNNSGSDQTITQGTSVTLRHAGTADTGNRTLAQYGVATLLCVATDTFVISGGGLT